MPRANISELKTKPPSGVEAATREVYRLLCRGLSRDDILEHAKREKWKLGRKAIVEVTEAAIARIVETASAISMDLATGKALERLENLYQESYQAKDYKTALAVQKEINSLLRVGEHARLGKGKPAKPAAQKKSDILRFKIRS